MYTRESLEALKRKQLQAVCKKYGIKANQKSSILVDLLLEYFAKNGQSQADTPDIEGEGAVVVEAEEERPQSNDKDDDEEEEDVSAVQPETQAEKAGESMPSPSRQCQKQEQEQVPMQVEDRNRSISSAEEQDSPRKKQKTHSGEQPTSAPAPAPAPESQVCQTAASETAQESMAVEESTVVEDEKPLFGALSIGAPSNASTIALLEESGKGFEELVTPRRLKWKRQSRRLSSAKKALQECPPDADSNQTTRFPFFGSGPVAPPNFENEAAPAPSSAPAPSVELETDVGAAVPLSSPLPAAPVEAASKQDEAEKEAGKLAMLKEINDKIAKRNEEAREKVQQDNKKHSSSKTSKPSSSSVSKATSSSRPKDRFERSHQSLFTQQASIFDSYKAKQERQKQLLSSQRSFNLSSSRSRSAAPAPSSSTVSSSSRASTVTTSSSSSSSLRKPPVPVISKAPSSKTTTTSSSSSSKPALKPMVPASVKQTSKESVSSLQKVQPSSSSSATASTTTTAKPKVVGKENATSTSTSRISTFKTPLLSRRVMAPKTNKDTPRPKFDIQASLARPVPWQLKTGPLPPVTPSAIVTSQPKKAGHR